MLTRSLLLFLLPGALAADGGSRPLAISLRQRPTGERAFVDERGRERVFHGVNAIVKGPPWHPAVDEFSTDISMTDEDFKIMQRLGLNLIRLGVMWPGVEPERGTYNESYIAVIKDIAQRASKYGIYTLLDMHQDALGEAFCGEGIPNWAFDGGGMQEGFPYPVDKAFNSTDEIGLPTRQDCQKHGWEQYYLSAAGAKGFQDLYSNVNGLLDSWANMWGHVAASFRNCSHILGIELINEPFAGNLYVDPLIMVPIGKTSADVKNLLPAYDRVAASVRAADPSRLIFFAGVTWDDFGSTFNRVPGNEKDAETSVLAYHYYAPPQLKPNSDFIASLQFDAQMKAARRLGSGLMLTETCNPACTDHSPGDFQHVAAAADGNLQSYATWEWKSFCRETDATRKGKSQRAEYGACITGYGPDWNSTTGPQEEQQYARTYVHSVAGNATSMSFDPESGVFVLEFSLDNDIDVPTEVFASNEHYYSTGIDIKIDPANSMDAKASAETNFVSFMPTSSAAMGMKIKITISPK
mmetsp:Transcript_31265/g.76274  ORF Transcript_31265/g.76274 Transcript_31265/m.76274 type:complete len:524 (-) Transcript_31265:367-1938(-)